MDIPVAKNENYIIDIVDLSSDGFGIGKIDGFTIFVEGALYEEQVEIKIVKVKKNYGFGKMLNIIKPSKFRVVPECSFSNKCGGCQLQHISYEGQLFYKTKKVSDCLKKIAGIKDAEVLPTIGAKNIYNYRNKCQFPVGKGKDGAEIGFYSKRSHNIVDIEGCMIQHSINDNILNIVRKFINGNNISVYNEIENTGLVRHIFTRVGFVTKEIMVCIVINGENLPFCKKLIEELIKIPGMTSIVLNINKKNTNVILGDKLKTLWGKEYITDYIGDVKFEISPLSFYQINPEQTKVLYEKAIESAGLKEEDNVFDLYCGIGTISLFIAKKVKSVTGVEIIPEAIEDAKRNAEINGIKNVQFIAGATEDVIPKLYAKGEKADVVVVDPPRKGCDIKVLDTIVNMSPKKVVYVSCDSGTMARDIKILCENGFVLKKVQPVDQFIFTTSVECVALLEK